MSGRKQHFIPQSLLRGFGREARGTKIQVVAYTHDRGVFTAATDGVGAERNFYSELALEPADETLDDKITKYEANVADVLIYLRGLATNEIADTEAAAELVTHLVVRNDHFRKTAAFAGSSLFGGFGELLTDEGAAKSLFGIAGDRPSAFFNEISEKLWIEHELVWRSLGISKEVFQQFAFAAFKGGFSEFHSQLAEPLQNAFSAIVEGAPEAAAKAQRRSLEQALSPPIRAKKLQEFQWQVIHWQGSLILSDCVAIGLDQNGDALPLMFAELDDLVAAFMPLSADRLLFGSRDDTVPPEQPNEVSASWAWDFFVGRERSAEFEALRSLLKVRLTPFLERMTKDVLGKAITQFSAE